MQAALLLRELERHAQFLALRIEQEGRRSRDIAGEIAELKNAYTTMVALAAHYGLPYTTATLIVLGHPGRFGGNVFTEYSSGGSCSADEPTDSVGPAEGPSSPRPGSRGGSHAR